MIGVARWYAFLLVYLRTRVQYLLSVSYIRIPTALQMDSICMFTYMCTVCVFVQ